MRWLTFSILAGVFLTLQAAIAPCVELIGWRPDWLIVLVVFVALYGQPTAAVAGSWCIGFAADLMSIERLGFLALSYCGVALLVVSAREYLFCYRSSTRFAVTTLVCLLVQSAWLVYASWQYGLYEGIVFVFIKQTLPVSLYTGVWAVGWHAVLSPVTGLLGFPQPKYSHHGLSRMVGAHV